MSKRHTILTTKTNLFQLQEKLKACRNSWPILEFFVSCYIFQQILYSQFEDNIRLIIHPMKVPEVFLIFPLTQIKQNAYFQFLLTLRSKKN